jgi:tyrosine-protein kinase Etk/Wzc
MDRYVQTIHRRDQHQSIAAVNRSAGVLDNVSLIAFVCILVTALGIMHALTATPLYEAGTVIQIKRNGGLTGDFSPEDNVRTEMEVLKSRSILARVVERLQLDVTLDRVPPTVSGAINRVLDRDQLADSAVSPRTQVHIARLELPAALLSRPFTMTITAKHGFHLANEELGISVHGIAGTPVRIDSWYGTIGVLIGRIAAAPGTQFVLRRISTAQATEQLQRALVVTENAKQSNVIRLKLQGADQQMMSRILGEVVAEYIQQRRAEQQSEAAELTASYDRQLSASKAAVQKVDAQYARVLRRSGIGDPEAEGQLLLQQSSALEMQLATAQQRKAELSARIGDGHPEMQALSRQIADTGRVLSRNAAKYESLSVAARELTQVRREKQALDEAALALVNQRSKLGAVTSAERGDVRVLEQPAPSLHPVTLGKSTMLILSFFGGIAAGLLASFLKNLLFQRKRVILSTQRNTRFRLISQGR